MQKRRKDRNSGVPDLSQLREEPEVYFEKHRVAVEQHDFKARVMASWGLIARGVESIPYLHRIPVIGNAFKNNSVTDSRKELLVFVTPRIVRLPEMASN